MSIYCSFGSIGGEHKPRCAKLKRIRPKVYEQDDSKPCTCGSSPIAYDHSGLLPSLKDKRGGHVGLAFIPSHITRDGRDDHPEVDSPWPFLRLDVFSDDEGSNYGTVILVPEQVESLRDSLSEWLTTIDRSRK